MSTFSLAISCLTTSTLPWFMAITFQVPMQYCSLQLRALLPSPFTPTTGCWFCFGSVYSFFLELFLHWSLIAYWAPTDLGSSSFSVFSFLSFFFFFCLFILSMGFPRQVACHSLLQWTTFCQKSPPWPICLGWPYTAWLSFTELDKTVVRVIRLTSCLFVIPVCLPSDALSQCLASYFGFSYLGRGITLHSCSSKAQPLLLTSDAG